MYCRNNLKITRIFLLLIFVFVELSCFSIFGTQNQLPYMVKFKLDILSHVQIHAKCLNSDSSNLQWKVYAVYQQQSLGSHNGLHQKLIRINIQQQILNDGTYIVLLENKQKHCENWTLQIVSPNLKIQIDGCQKLSEDNLKKCQKCNSQTPFLVNINQIPLVQCKSKIVKGCQIHQSNLNLCEICQTATPHLIKIKNQNQQVQQLCVQQKIQRCLIYTNNGLQCHQYMHKTVERSLLEISNTGVQTNAVLRSAQCSDPNYPIYAQIQGNSNNLQCIEVIQKNFTFEGLASQLEKTVYFITSDSCHANITINWIDTKANIDFELKKGENSLYSSTKSSNSLQSSIYLIPQAGNYTLLITHNNEVYVDYTVRFQMNCLITNNINKCESYNSNQDHCTLCNQDYPNLVVTNQIPLEGCASQILPTSESGSSCQVYDSQASTCQAYCNSLTPFSVITNSTPVRICVGYLIDYCQVYSTDGESCLCRQSHKHYVQIEENPPFPCVTNKIKYCIVYNMYGNGCICSKNAPFYVLTEQNSQICIQKLIKNCQIYSSDGSQCHTFTN